MPMVAVNPKAYLRRLKNVRRGVIARSKIIEALGDISLTVQQIHRRTGLSPQSVRYHLGNMLAEGIVSRKLSGRRAWWNLTGAGQKTLEESLEG
ncbi:hypothetical protein HRbin01_00878 [archaeon HR01]|nr:hypothetical protein HRbin01_00878 [archaeon HR01]